MFASAREQSQLSNEKSQIDPLQFGASKQQTKLYLVHFFSLSILRNTYSVNKFPSIIDYITYINRVQHIICCLFFFHILNVEEEKINYSNLLLLKFAVIELFLFFFIKINIEKEKMEREREYCMQIGGVFQNPFI